MSEADQVLRTIDEDLKKDQRLKLWKLVAPYVIGVGVGVIAVTLGTVGWQSYREARDRAWGESYTLAMQLADEGNEDVAIEEFAALADQAGAGSGYATLATIQQAALLADQGAHEAAAALYLQLRDQAEDPDLRSMVTLLWSLSSLDTAPADDLRAALDPLADEDSPWRFSARELLGHLAGREGERAFQVEIFQELAKDPLTPPGMRGRAQEVLSLLGAPTQ